MLRRTATLVAIVALTAALGGAALAQDRSQDPYKQLFNQGLELLKNRKYDESIDAFKKAIELDKTLPEGYYNIACAFALRGEKDKALDWFAESLAHGFSDKPHIETDTDLRRDPRRAALQGAHDARVPGGPSRGVAADAQGRGRLAREAQGEGRHRERLAHLVRALQAGDPAPQSRSGTSSGRRASPSSA